MCVEGKPTASNDDVSAGSKAKVEKYGMLNKLRLMIIKRLFVKPFMVVSFLVIMLILRLLTRNSKNHKLDVNNLLTVILMPTMIIRVEKEIMF